MSLAETATANIKQAKSKPRAALSRLERAERFWGWVMILPLVIGLTVFYFIPFLQNIVYSFTDLNQFMSWTTISFDNYINLFEDDDFYTAAFNTLFYVVVCVPVILLLSLLLAIGLNQNIRGKALLRTLLFLPAVTMPAAVAMVWQWLFNKDFGLINQGAKPAAHCAGRLALPIRTWYAFSVSIIIIWSSLALKIIILLAGLQSIPRQLYEAADIDGISTLRRFFLYHAADDGADAVLCVGDELYRDPANL
ncbi:sn-glycerol-3-phosphate transport system permease protein ugpA [Serratia fonticola]|uniref:sn-glycerol-3-phosphate transport system permease protein ugpA n=1 Tax=Serratia fonticola TaxID=47917 RepID=A0A4U9W503_SERFO|nr:sn-glycerol-3-phosphate transport system permease protein ugpA [Serratia fonticola]